LNYEYFYGEGEEGKGVKKGRGNEGRKWKEMKGRGQKGKEKEKGGKRGPQFTFLAMPLQSNSQSVKHFFWPKR